MVTLSYTLHPHHISLMRNQISVQPLLCSFKNRGDPCYKVYGEHPHGDINSPCFDISETENSYLLDGELAGLIDRKQLIVEWLQDQVLVIRGTIGPGNTEKIIDPFQKDTEHDLLLTEEHKGTPKNLKRCHLDTELDQPVFTGPRLILQERHVGEFERSFTFPNDINSDCTEASLVDGLLRIVVLKKLGVAVKKKGLAAL